MSLEEKRFYIYPQELFDDQDFTRLDLIIYGRIKCLKKGLITNYEKAAEMFGVSEIAIKRAVPKLMQKGWLIRKGRVIITLDHPFIESIKNDTEENQKVSKTIPEKYQERYSESIKNDTHNSITNKTKNNIKKDTPSLILIGSNFKATQEQIDEIIKQDGKQAFESRVQCINDYCASHGKNYKDYPAAYRQFRARDQKDGKPAFNPTTSLSRPEHRIVKASARMPAPDKEFVKSLMDKAFKKVSI